MQSICAVDSFCGPDFTQRTMSTASSSAHFQGPMPPQANFTTRGRFDFEHYHPYEPGFYGGGPSYVPVPQPYLSASPPQSNSPLASHHSGSRTFIDQSISSQPSSPVPRPRYPEVILPRPESAYSAQQKYILATPQPPYYFQEPSIPPPSLPQPEPNEVPKDRPFYKRWWVLVALALIAAIAIAVPCGVVFSTKKLFKPTTEDYQRIYNATAKTLLEKNNYDDGSYGPILLRLAWHASGTYDAATGTGGSNGATLRFAPESKYRANAGLKIARDFLEPIKGELAFVTEKFNRLLMARKSNSPGSRTPISGLSPVSAPCKRCKDPSFPGDQGDRTAMPPSARPTAVCPMDPTIRTKSVSPLIVWASTIRKWLLSRVPTLSVRPMTPQSCNVRLSLTLSTGHCHIDRSGYDGPWTFSPTVMTNEYFSLLIEEKWDLRSWSGPKQYQDETSKSLMMLPSDMALLQDPIFKTHVERYANDSEGFFKDFSDVVVKLFELGVPFKSTPKDRIMFKPTINA
jgi:cytochrome c peroxidase